MAKKRTGKAPRGGKKTPRVLASPQEPNDSKSLEVIRQGIQTTDDFLRLSGAMLSDLVEGKMTTEVGNTMSQVARNMLQMLKLKLIFEKPTPQSAGKPLRICS